MFRSFPGICQHWRQGIGRYDIFSIHFIYSIFIVDISDPFIIYFSWIFQKSSTQPVRTNPNNIFLKVKNVRETIGVVGKSDANKVNITPLVVLNLRFEHSAKARVILLFTL